MCKIDATKLVIDFPTLETVERNIRNIFYELVPDKTWIVDETTLSEETLENYKSKKRFLDNIVANYGPTYMGLLGKKAKPIIGSYIKSSGYSKTHVWSIIRNYLQSGFDDTSLLDHRGTKSVSRYNYEKKPGRKPDDTKINKGRLLAEDDYKNFEKYINKYMKSEVKSIQNAYDDMCDECYSSWAEIDGKYIQRLNEDRATYNQFYFYVKNKTTPEERDAAKSTWRVIRNVKRVFTGTVMDGVLGPGHVVEMDATTISRLLRNELATFLEVG